MTTELWLPPPRRLWNGPSTRKRQCQAQQVAFIDPNYRCDGRAIRELETVCFNGHSNFEYMCADHTEYVMSIKTFFLCDHCSAGPDKTREPYVRTIAW